MTYAAITGWGKCMPPAVLSNADLATFMETTTSGSPRAPASASGASRTSRSPTLAHVAAARALACAGLDPKDLDLIVLGSCSYDEQVPNSASGRAGAPGRARTPPPWT